MKSTKENKRSPIPRGSPSSSSSHTKSPSQLSTTYLIRNSSSSPSPGRKRQHPNYLQLDEGVPPNKKINTPTVSAVYCTQNILADSMLPIWGGGAYYSMKWKNSLGRFPPISPNMPLYCCSLPPLSLSHSLSLSHTLSLSLSHTLSLSLSLSV